MPQLEYTFTQAATGTGGRMKPAINYERLPRLSLSFQQPKNLSKQVTILPTRSKWSEWSNEYDIILPKSFVEPFSPEVPGPTAKPIDPHALSTRVQHGLLRLLVSVALLLAYISLTAVACTRSISLGRVSISRRKEAQGLLTIIAILWIAIALFPLRGIFAFIFSSEWSHIFTRTRRVSPGETDRVSVLTAGISERAAHSFTPGASWTFRLAFITSAISFAVAGIAPGVLSISVISIPLKTRLSIGDLNRMMSIEPEGLMQDRAAIITRMERIENTQFGFQMLKRGAVVGWPSTSLSLGAAGKVTYPSDVLRYRYECTWIAPNLVDIQRGSASENGIWSLDGDIGGRKWTNGYNTPRHIETGIFPLRSIGNQAANDGTSAWLFLGSNSSYSLLGGVLDLSGVPSTLNSTGGWITSTHACAGSCSQPLASILACNPRMSVSSALVTFSSSDRSLSVAPDDLPYTVGNIPSQTAPIFLSQCLESSTRLSQNTMTSNLTDISRKLFIQGVSSPEESPATPLTVKPAFNISSDIGPYVTSAMKAYSDGYLGPNNFSTMVVDAMQDEQRLALVGSVPLTVISGALSVLVIGLTIVLLLTSDREPLNITTLKKVLP